MTRTTHTYATTNIVIDVVGCSIWAEDFSHETPAEMTNPFLHERASRFIDKAHVRVFTNMHAFTRWLHEVGAVVDKCWILGETLSDEERSHG